MVKPLLPGDDTRLGRYDLVGRLGQGGMGTVFLGRDDRGRRVAIKMVRPEFAHDEEFRGRFRSEVTRAQQVPPFSTAEVLDADPDHDPPYLVVEYVDGPSLAAVVGDTGPMSGGALHGVAVGIATALTAIHGAGVIHRDLKPANVLVAMGGIKVIDFGIARPFEATSKHTRTDHMVGTVAYMAPERFDPDGGGRLGPAADVFAWGVVVAFAATGRTPFAADSAPGTAMRILTQPPDLDGVPEPLRELVNRALAKDPVERPTARQLFELLTTSGTTGTTARPSIRKRRRGVVIGLSAAGVLLVAAATLLGLHHRATTAGNGTAAVSDEERAAGVLDGTRKTRIHLAGIDRNLALDYASPMVEASADEGSNAEFALVPQGVDYLVRSLNRGAALPRTCLGVRVDPDSAGMLVPTTCAASKATVFTLQDTGEGTYLLVNPEYGTVRWAADEERVVIGFTSSPEPELPVSFEDLGPLDE
ncbi:serine/threonine-protein kinase [Actinoplanes sp. NPDC051494]|uniref:serine/threonine-protein kinase n=1 Tax=Actinoplanes sp. NPDC051494 TaxID=3363907 RepID=UPI003789B2E7